MKRIFLLLFFILTAIYSYGQKNLTLLSNLPITGTCAGVWHYNDDGGHEYALVGTSYGLTIVDITNPANPMKIFDVPDTQSTWREVKVWSHYAYVTNEGYGIPGLSSGGGGVTIIDLSNLPGTPVYKKFTAGGISTAHTVEIADGYLYLNGINGFGHTDIYSLADPWNPVHVGSCGTAYVHDCFVRGDTIVTSQIYNPSHFVIIDISDKANPRNLASNTTPANFNHNSSMSDDGHYLFTTDEKTNAALAAYDISNLANIQLLGTYRTTRTPTGEVHNVHVFGDFLVNACYGAQVTLVDASRPSNLIEVGDYPVGTYISWDADPYTASGNIIATDYSNGLFIFAPTYRHACFLEGIVTDSITGSPINGVKAEIITPPGDTITLASDNSLFTGTYKTGLADSGTYDVRFSKTGYITKVVAGVNLKNGMLTTLDVKLWNGATGIKVNEQAPGHLLVYPNPVSRDATININPSLLNNPHLFLLLTDVSGKVVRTMEGIRDARITLHRNGIAAGSYHLQLLDNNGRIADETIVFE